MMNEPSGYVYITTIISDIGIESIRITSYSVFFIHNTHLRSLLDRTDTMYN